MAITLALSTATKNASVALLAGKKVLAQKEWQSESNESAVLLPNIGEILRRARVDFSDIKSIRVVSGPGLFSALRIGATVANTLAFILKIPLYESGSGLPEEWKKVRVATPRYEKAPNITISRKNLS